MYTCEVLIRTKNSITTLRPLIASLYAQRGISFILRVCDSGTDQETTAFFQQHDCHYERIASSEYVPSEVLNRLIQQSTSENIVLLNSDAILLTDHSLHDLLRELDSSSQVAAVYGRQVAHVEHAAWVQRDYLQSFPEHSLEKPLWIYFSAPLAALKKSVWKQRPFYSQAWGSEDTEWGKWCTDNSYKVEYVPTALCLHSHEYSAIQAYRRKFIEGEADSFIFPSKNLSVIQSFLSACRRSLSDFRWMFTERRFNGGYQSFYIRFFESMGYYRGFKWGRHRKSNDDVSLSTGKNVVLKNYD